MSFRIDVYVHHDDESALQRIENTVTRLEGIVSQVLTGLQAVQLKESQMSNELTALTAQVAENTTVEQSAITLLAGLSAQIAALKDDPAAIQALADSLKASGDALAAAIVANTPAG